MLLSLTGLCFSGTVGLWGLWGRVSYTQFAAMEGWGFVVGSGAGTAWPAMLELINIWV